MGYVFHGATRRAFCEFIKPDKIGFILLKPSRLMKAARERELHGGSFVTGPHKAPRVGLWLKKRQDSETARWGFGGGRGRWLPPLLKKSSHFYPLLPTVWPVEVCKVWYFCTVQTLESWSAMKRHLGGISPKLEKPVKSPHHWHDYNESFWN